MLNEFERFKDKVESRYRVKKYSTGDVITATDVEEDPLTEQSKLTKPLSVSASADAAEEAKKFQLPVINPSNGAENWKIHGSPLIKLPDGWEQEAMNAAVGALDAGVNGLTRDKTFNGQSQAIDLGVHTASKALMKFGPWGMAAAGALEAVNGADKLFGKTIQGFSTDIAGSGYGKLGLQADTTLRASQGGWNPKKINALLDKRNEQAMLSLKAAEISDASAYELEARGNSIDDTLKRNNIALNGGVDPSLLAN